MKNKINWKAVKRKSLLGFSSGILGLWVPLLVGLDVFKIPDDKGFVHISYSLLILFIFTGSAAGLVYKSSKMFIRGFLLGISPLLLLLLTNLIPIATSETLRMLGEILAGVNFCVLPGALLGLLITSIRNVKKVLVSCFIGAIINLLLIGLIFLPLLLLFYKTWFWFALIMPYMIFGAFIWFAIGIVEEIYKENS